MTALKSLLFLIVAPGMVAGYIPLVLLSSGPQVATGFFAYLVFPLWSIGTAILLWSFWNFFREGRGTPSPTDPPKELVAVGFYRYVRNPMYSGIVMILTGYFLWFGYWSLLIYTALIFVVIHLFVTLYEEPTLKRKFGASYEEYLKYVMCRAGSPSCTGNDWISSGYKLRRFRYLYFRVQLSSPARK